MTAPNDHLLFFHLGPVQGFIAEARRTRDLWTGSFILSWLSGLAMREVVKAGGNIIAPSVDGEPLFAAICGGAPAEYLPSLPNHFKATVPAGFDPELCRKALYEGWEALASAVFNEMVRPSLPNGVKEERWNETIRSGRDGRSHALWDIYWVMGPTKDLLDVKGILERRKVWRNLPLVESGGGDFCTMMPRFRELSGIGGASRGGRKEKDLFWKTFRDNLSSLLKEGTDSFAELLEIRPGEALSPIALVKRLSPRLKASTLKAVFGWLPPSHSTNAAQYGIAKSERLLASYRPSLAALAATHWMIRAKALAPRELDAFVSAVGRAASRALVLAERCRKCPALAQVGGAAQLDGKLFDPDYWALVEQRFGTELAEPGFTGKSALSEAMAALKDLQRATEENTGEAVGAPSGYYAILMADGDLAGKILSVATQEAPYLKALAAFSAAMPSVIEKHNGELIYAGGDDLLALLPIEDALEAASDVRKCFEKAVQTESQLWETLPSLSAAVVFVHTKVSLGSALEIAHSVLDNIAKEANGRDSLAIHILRGGGHGATWVSRWSTAHDAVEAFSGIAADRSLHRLMSNRFVYGINDRLPGLLVPWRPKSVSSGGNRDGRDLSTGEGYVDLSKDGGFAKLEELVRGVSTIGRDSGPKPALGRLRTIIERRGVNRDQQEITLPDPSLDGLMILRFLGREWRKRPDAAPPGNLP